MIYCLVDKAARFVSGLYLKILQKSQQDFITMCVVMYDRITAKEVCSFGLGTSLRVLYFLKKLFIVPLARLKQ